ncbi:hypothetical protein NDR87_13540 [Nocardia sp. CDC159]|uniref:Uncharacterized protein n=1 Tax=Nocardia pulmonis TaxID=2951408 RepID=A0A9X2E5D8_9NOCA|nr:MULTISPECIES: hypothetical protein [Nocardia]MCM6774554.1 hypothetical protein [Nocardia pulmonis]MCM6787381.1 hypothetical protein [Nocardia sp. CDC159]
MKRLRDIRQLKDSAAAWMHDAMDAWSDDKYEKVAVLAPLAVEHLGKALLWRTNPVLVVPLLPEAEASLVKLATAPSLADPKLRTIGLRLLLSRIEAATGALPLNAERRTRMVEVRNGATHVAAAITSRHVLIDSLTVCNVFLERLGLDPLNFYREHLNNVTQLVAQGRSEVEHRVAAKRARARKELDKLAERLSLELFEELTDRMVEDARRLRELPLDGWAITQYCPECGRPGSLAGAIEVDPQVEVAHEPGVETPYASVAGYEVTMSPDRFACSVCRLALEGTQELAAAGMPASAFGIDPGDLGPEFDPAEEAAQRYDFDNY